MTHRNAPPPHRGLTLAHMTNLQDEERCAFMHAVALARQSESRLISIHADADPAALARMPRAEAWLSQWAARAPQLASAPPVSVDHACIVDSCCDDPVDTLLRAVRRVGPQLVITTTSGREGLSRALLGSVAEALALQVTVPTLLFPWPCRSFISEDSGAVQLRRILVAAGDADAAQTGAEFAAWLARVAGTLEVEVELLHVEDGKAMPSLHPPAETPARFSVQTVRGSVDEALLARSESARSDVLVIATRGHDSLRDVLFGSHAERVLRRAGCPVLSIPLR